MNSVIFLDFDGVLNSMQSFIQNHENHLFYGRLSGYTPELYYKCQLSDLDFEKLQLL